MGVLTGVLEISKESVFSELNNVDVYTIADEELSHYFGFTFAEVEELFKAFDIQATMSEVEHFYGGYGGGKEKVFNPWSILNFANRQRFLPYWLNTGSNNFINSLLSQRPQNLDRLLLLVNNAHQAFRFERAISFRDLNTNSDVLFSLLVHSGYLSAVYIEGPTFMLTIPNEETRGVLEREIIARNSAEPIGLEDARSLRRALLIGDKEGIEKQFARIFFSYSYFDLNSEKSYQNAITGVLAILFDEYIVKSEVNSAKGRCDIMVSPKREQCNGIIIELKRYKGRESESKAVQKSVIAFNQIASHHYADELIRRECKNVFLYAFIIFDNGFRVFSKTGVGLEK